MGQLRSVWMVPLLSFGLGIAVALLGGLPPSLQAARRDPTEGSGGCTVNVVGPDHPCIGSPAEYKVKYTKDGKPVDSGLDVIWTLVHTPNGSANQFKPGKNPPPMTTTPALAYNNTAKAWQLTHRLEDPVKIQWDGGGTGPLAQANKEGDLTFKVTVDDKPQCHTTFTRKVLELLQLRVCLRPVQGKNNGGTQSDLKKIKGDIEAGINAIYSPCCIFFKVDVSLDVDLMNGPFAANGDLAVADNSQQIKLTEVAKSLFKRENVPDCLNVYFVKNATFSSEPPTLLGVADLGNNGAIVDDPAAGPSAKVIAHELGHNLGLPDLKGKSNDAANLMFGIEKEGAEGGTTLTEKQCEDARNAVRQYQQKFKK